ncbi:MAG: hypothetical protein AABZ64_03630, partial [Nitrospinota bacterium]
MPDLPFPVLPPGAAAVQGAALSEELVRLMPGEIFLAALAQAPAGAPPGSALLRTEGQELLVRLALGIPPGENVLAEVLPRKGEGNLLLLRLLARAGEPGGKLELPAQGPLRLAPGEGIPTPLRMLLAKGPLAGEVLPFESRAAAG